MLDTWSWHDLMARGDAATPVTRPQVRSADGLRLGTATCAKHKSLYPRAGHRPRATGGRPQEHRPCTKRDAPSLEITERPAASLPVPSGGGRIFVQGRAGCPNVTHRKVDPQPVLHRVGGGRWQGAGTSPEPVCRRRWRRKRYKPKYLIDEIALVRDRNGGVAQRAFLLQSRITTVPRGLIQGASPGCRGWRERQLCSVGSD
jgi:hypothetical protein